MKFVCGIIIVNGGKVFGENLHPDGDDGGEATKEEEMTAGTFQLLADNDKSGNGSFKV